MTAAAPAGLFGNFLPYQERNADAFFGRADDVARLDKLLSGAAHLVLMEVPSLIPVVDAGDPVIILSGVHPGCYELFATERVQSIRDLKG